MGLRLGLDIGTNSIGWAVFQFGEDKQPVELLDAGVRIYSDGRNPKNQRSLAATRRLPRGIRRNRDRKIKRRDEFMSRLITFGLMPADEAERKKLETLDPWRLRVEGLDRKLSHFELGRALFHLQQRRGLKSNRKTDSAADDSGKIKVAAQKLVTEMEAAGARTLGEYLGRPRVDGASAQHDHPVRVRLDGAGAKAFYHFYPMRDMVVAEFDALWAKQKECHGAGLSDEARDGLRDSLTFQRPLKPQPVGRCTLDPNEERAPRALPSVQRFRIYQEVNHLAYRLPGEGSCSLTLEQRNRLVARALAQKELKFER